MALVLRAVWNHPIYPLFADTIPNSEVKQTSADDSVPATGCENRSVPGPSKKED